MRMSFLLWTCFLALSGALLPSLAQAQTLTIGSAEARRGTTVDIPVEFVPGEVDVIGFQLGIRYDPAVFDAPTCLAGTVFICEVNHALGRVAMSHVDFNLQPLSAQTFATIRFPVRRMTGRGVRSALGAFGVMFVDAESRSRPFAIYTGVVDVR